MGCPSKNEAPLAYRGPMVKGALVASRKGETMTRKDKYEQFTSTRYGYCWCFFDFNHVKCLDLSREKRVPLPYVFLKGKSHLSLKSTFCLNNFQIDVFLPDSVCSVHSAFSCQCCLQETLLPTHHPSSKYLFCSQQLKGQNPHFPLLEAVLGALPIQTLPCASICWNLPSSAKHSVTVQAEINLPAL